MTRSESFLETLVILCKALPSHHDLFMSLQSKFSLVVNEFQEEADKVKQNVSTYWAETALGAKPKCVSFDNGKTVFKLTATPYIPTPEDVVIHFNIHK